MTTDGSLGASFTTGAGYPEGAGRPALPAYEDGGRADERARKAEATRAGGR